MTQEDKELLLRDLSARLPYGVFVKVIDHNDKAYTSNERLLVIENVRTDCEGVPFLFKVTNVYTPVDITEIKPYLRPMSSMTEEELAEWQFELDMDIDGYCIPSYPALDWLNTHHFDYRGLIEKGLALEAPEGMYKTE